MICIPIKNNDISNIIFHLAFLKVLKRKTNGLLSVTFSLRLLSEIFWLKRIFTFDPFEPFFSVSAYNQLQVAEMKCKKICIVRENKAFCPWSPVYNLN